MSDPAAWMRRLLTLGLALGVGFAAAGGLPRIGAVAVDRERLNRALLQPNLPENRRHLLTIFESMDSSSVEPVSQAVERYIKWLPECVYRPFLHAWLRFDREDALKHASTWPRHHQTIRAIGEAVSFDAAAGRHQTARELMESGVPGRTLHTDRFLLQSDYLREWIYGGASPEEILSYMENLPDTTMHTPIAREATPHLITARGMDSAIDWADQVGERFGARVVDVTFSSIVQHLAINDPERARQWLEERSHIDGAKDAQEALALIWVESDPASALEWSLTLRRPQRKGAISGVLRRWITEDPEVAAMWARKHLPVDAYAIALPELIGGLSYSVPEEAAYWAQKTSDPARRDFRLTGILRTWWKSDAAAADRWVAAAKLSPQLQKTLEATREKSLAELSATDSPDSHKGI